MNATELLLQLLLFYISKPDSGRHAIKVYPAHRLRFFTVSLTQTALQTPRVQEVAAWPIFVHPVQNFSVVQFDPSTVKAPFTAAALSWREMDDEVSHEYHCVGGGRGDFCMSPPPLRPGDAAEFHGLTSANAPVKQRTVVVKLERLTLASSAHPQYTAHSVEVGVEKEGAG